MPSYKFIDQIYGSSSSDWYKMRRATSAVRGLARAMKGKHPKFRYREQLVYCLKPLLHAQNVANLRSYVDKIATLTCRKLKREVFLRIFLISRKQHTLKHVNGLKVDFSVALQCFSDIICNKVQLPNSKMLLRQASNVLEHFTKGTRMTGSLKLMTFKVENFSGSLSIVLDGNGFVCTIEDDSATPAAVELLEQATENAIIAEKSIAIAVDDFVLEELKAVELRVIAPDVEMPLLPETVEVEIVETLVEATKVTGKAAEKRKEVEKFDEPETELSSKLDDNDADMQSEREKIPLAIEVNIVTTLCPKCAVSTNCSQCLQTTIRNEVSDIKPQNYAQTECTDDLHLPMNENSFEVADLDFWPEEYFKASSVVAAAPEELSDVLAHEYELLQRYDDLKYVRNMEEFTCSMCFVLIAPSQGIVLRECIHEFCMQCLVKYIDTVNDIKVQCPFKSDAYDCIELVQQRDLRAVLPEVKFNALLDKSLMEFESLPQNDTPMLSASDIVDDSFCCGSCFSENDAAYGFRLQNCGHKLCRPCLLNAITSRKALFAICPYDGCLDRILDEEIACLLDADQLRAYELSLQDELENILVVPNTIEFDCSICMCACNVGDGIMLRACLHHFCKACIAGVVHNSNECEQKCPYINQMNSGCEGIIQEREIRGILTDKQFDAYINRTQKLNLDANAFPCRTLDCDGRWIIEPGDVEFKCILCETVNCLKCKTIHENLTCEQFEEVRSGRSSMSQNYIRTMISNGTAMLCPQCQAVITKSEGCDAIICNICKTDICWATKGRRWGPFGKGDTSAGCRCRLINHQLCHPNCANCH